jgi:outer membrane receptor protein involved in Fe transport
VFRYKYTNLQSLTLVPASATSGIPSYQVVNSDQKATGLDLEAQWKIDRIWRLTGSLEYLDQTYDHYLAPTGVTLDGQPAGAPSSARRRALRHAGRYSAAKRISACSTATWATSAATTTHANWAPACSATMSARAKRARKSTCDWAGRPLPATGEWA